MRRRLIDAMLKVQVELANRFLREGGERAGKLMAEAKGINPEIAPEEVKEEVKELTAEVVEKAPSLYTLYAMAAVLLLALTFLVIGLSGNPLSYVPPPMP